MAPGVSLGVDDAGLAIGIDSQEGVLVARGDRSINAHMLIASALGAGLSVPLAGALMSLVFLSSSSGHDAEANRFEEDETIE